MHFVHEDDGPRAILARPFGIGHDLLDFLDAGQDRGKFDEIRVGHARDDFGERGFADAWGAPKEQRASVVALDLHPQRLAWRENMLLPDELVQAARAHAIGQRPGFVNGIVSGRDLLKQIHGISFTTEGTGDHGDFTEFFE